MATKDVNDGPRKGQQDFSTLDDDFIRVLEDLVDALLSNGTLRLTDLPPQALEKLNRRKQVRERLRNSLDLLPDDDGLI
ncbi:hypothetical protein [Comamonas jiangduensis]|uniref:Tryptophan synthase subunit beta like protein n=1 Tax=Comamonas jiangduensis TaxID=1194168 RepID=A0ABV4IFL1_9BURK